MGDKSSNTESLPQLSGNLMKHNYRKSSDKKSVFVFVCLALMVYEKEVCNCSRMPGENSLETNHILPKQLKI
jgi:hypothetical protein